jgi:hypothetical protein
MKKERDAASLAIAILAVAAPTVVAFGVAGPLRTAVALPLVSLLPGLALVRVVHPIEHLNSTVVLAIAVTLALDVVASLTMVYLHAWSVVSVLALLAIVALSATVARHVVMRRRTA